MKGNAGMSRYSVTYDHYSIYLWCNDCDNDSEDATATFFGNPEDLDNIRTARDEHEAEHHAAVPVDAEEAGKS